MWLTVHTAGAVADLPLGDVSMAATTCARATPSSVERFGSLSSLGC